MKKKWISSIIIIVIIVSIGAYFVINERPKSSINEKPKFEKTDEEKTGSMEDFNWNTAKQLKAELIKNLSEKNKPVDELISNFLDEYSKIENDLNEVLYNQKDYDTLNTLAMGPDEKANKKARIFKKIVKNNGFDIECSEGMIYIVQNTNFIKKDITPYLDSISLEFINLYCNELDNYCCSDGGLIIAEAELFQRIYEWGELISKVESTKYNERANTEYELYLSLIFIGSDNSLAFDGDAGEYNKTYFDLMQKYITSFPNSQFAKDCKEYSDLLIAEKMKQTDKIDDYLKRFDEED